MPEQFLISESYNQETTNYNGKTYNVEGLFDFADTLPVHEIPLEQLTEAVGSGHKYWEDTEGQSFGPSVLLDDWPAAQQNPKWQEHVKNIKAANLDYPIWVGEHGEVFNGVHRLTKAFLDNLPTIKVRYFKKLPSEALAQS